MSFNLSGKVKWAFVQKPNQFGKYSVDLVIDDKVAQKFRDRGVSGVKEDDDGDTIIQIKTNAFNKDGDENPSPVVTYEGTAFDGLVGNGSDVSVSFDISPWKFGNKTGESAWLRSLEINTLVPYGDDEDFGAAGDGDDEPF